MDEYELRKLEKLANFMDQQFKIPGFGIPFGMDSIIGLIPGIGDTATLMVSAYIVNKARPHVTPYVFMRMMWNIFIDWLIGIVPFVGDIFDVGWKANRMNVDLLKEHLKTKPYDAKGGSALFI
jgi:hypothetical protein